MSWTSKTIGCGFSSSRISSKFVEPVTIDLRPLKPLAVALALVEPVVIALAWYNQYQYIFDQLDQ